MVAHDVDETVLTLIGSGQADTRPAIVKQTGLAPSTVSAAVSRLVEAGVITEAEHSVSTGGRRARRLFDQNMECYEKITRYFDERSVELSSVRHN